MAEDTRIVVDLSNAPPAQGGQTDHVPPGWYILRLNKLYGITAQTGTKGARAEMSVLRGEYEGSKIQGSFYFGSQKSKFGEQRFHAFLIACGAKVSAGPLDFNGDTLIGRPLIALIADETFERNDGSKGVSSRPMEFYGNQNIPEEAVVKLGLTRKTETAPEAAAATPAAVPQPAPAPQPVAVAPAAPAVAVVEAAPVPVAAPVPAPVAPPAPVQVAVAVAPAAETAQDVDSLFG